MPTLVANVVLCLMVAGCAGFALALALGRAEPAAGLRRLRPASQRLYLAMLALAALLGVVALLERAVVPYMVERVHSVLAR